MVKFHPVNRTMTLGTSLFIASLIVLGIGAIFHANQTLLAYTFLYGGLAFLASLVLLAVGAVLGARSGNLKNRAKEIFNNKKRS